MRKEVLGFGGGGRQWEDYVFRGGRRWAEYDSALSVESVYMGLDCEF